MTDVSKQWRDLYEASTNEGRVAMRGGLLDYMRCLGYQPLTASDTAAVACRTKKCKLPKTANAEIESLERTIAALERAYAKLASIDTCRIEGGGGGTDFIAPLRIVDAKKQIAVVTLDADAVKRLTVAPPRRRRRSMKTTP